jgi:hypothetical protein
MFVNVTLFVQVVHFLIAYLLLRLFLYKPIVALIEREDQTQAVLIEDITKKRAIVTHLRQKLDEHWRVGQAQLVHKKPEIPETMPHVQVPSLSSVPSLSAQEQQKHVETMVQSVVARIDHVP